MNERDWNDFFSVCAAYTSSNSKESLSWILIEDLFHTSYNKLPDNLMISDVTEFYETLRLYLQNTTANIVEFYVNNITLDIRPQNINFILFAYQRMFCNFLQSDISIIFVIMKESIRKLMRCVC